MTDSKYDLETLKERLDARNNGIIPEDTLSKLSENLLPKGKLYLVLDEGSRESLPETREEIETYLRREWNIPKLEPAEDYTAIPEDENYTEPQVEPVIEEIDYARRQIRSLEKEILDITLKRDKYEQLYQEQLKRVKEKRSELKSARKDLKSARKELESAQKKLEDERKGKKELKGFYVGYYKLLQARTRKEIKKLYEQISDLQTTLEDLQDETTGDLDESARSLLQERIKATGLEESIKGLNATTERLTKITEVSPSGEFKLSIEEVCAKYLEERPKAKLVGSVTDKMSADPQFLYLLAEKFGIQSSESGVQICALQDILGEELDKNFSYFVSDPEPGVDTPGKPTKTKVNPMEGKANHISIGEYIGELEDKGSIKEADKIIKSLNLTIPQETDNPERRLSFFYGLPDDVLNRPASEFVGRGNNIKGTDHAQYEAQLKNGRKLVIDPTSDEALTLGQRMTLGNNNQGYNPKPAEKQSTPKSESKPKAKKTRKSRKAKKNKGKK